MIKPAYPKIRTTGIATDLVWADLQDRDGAGGVRAGSQTTRDLVSLDEYTFAGTFNGTEGVRASPDRTQYGTRINTNSYIDYAASLGGVDFTLLSGHTPNWMLVLHLRTSGTGSIIHIGNAVGGDEDFYLDVSGTQVRIRHGGAWSSYNWNSDATPSGTFADLSPLKSGTKDMVLVFASVGNGRVKLTWTDHGAMRYGPNITGAARNYPSSPLRLGRRHPGSAFTSEKEMTIYSVQVYERATVFTDAEMYDLAADPYVAFEESEHPDAVVDQARVVMGYDRPMCWIGDSQSVENPNRLPHGVKSRHVPFEKCTSMFASIYAESAAVSATRTLEAPVGTKWGAVLDPSSAGVPASLDGLLTNAAAIMTLTAITSNETVLFEQRLWDLDTQLKGAGIWTTGQSMRARLLLAWSSAMSVPSELGIRATRPGTPGIQSDFEPIPAPSVNGYQSQQVTIPANASQSSVYLRLETPSAFLGPWPGDIAVAGGYYEVLDGVVRKPGYGHDSIAHASWSARTFLDHITAIGMGAKWGLTVVPTVVNIMLGHNQTAAHQVQLDAGSVTGDYTDDIAELIVQIRRGLAVARNIALDWQEPTVLVLTTPWRAAASSPMTNATNGATVNAVHESVALVNNMPHLSLYSRFGGESPIPGLHPENAGELATVADGWAGLVRNLAGALQGPLRLTRGRGGGSVSQKFSVRVQK